MRRKDWLIFPTVAAAAAIVSIHFIFTLPSNGDVTFPPCAIPPYVFIYSLLYFLYLLLLYGHQRRFLQKNVKSVPAARSSSSSFAVPRLFSYYKHAQSACLSLYKISYFSLFRLFYRDVSVWAVKNVFSHRGRQS